MHPVDQLPQLFASLHWWAHSLLTDIDHHQPIDQDLTELRAAVAAANAWLAFEATPEEREQLTGVGILANQIAVGSTFRAVQVPPSPDGAYTAGGGGAELGFEQGTLAPSVNSAPPSFSPEPPAGMP